MWCVQGECQRYAEGQAKDVFVKDLNTVQEFAHYPEGLKEAQGSNYNYNNNNM